MSHNWPVLKERVIRALTGSIPRRILASLAAIYAATYLATAIVVYSSVRDSILESSANELHQLAERKFERLDNRLGSAAVDVSAWSQLDVMTDLVSGDIDKRIARTLEGLKRLYRLEGDLYAFDASGLQLASTAQGHMESGALAIPDIWRDRSAPVSFIGKHPDPGGGGDIVALEAQVFASFDSSYRIGTLVLTVPWRSVEASLFGGGSGTILIESGRRHRVLAADPAGVLARVDDPFQIGGPTMKGGLIVGRSASVGGMLEHWQVIVTEDDIAVSRALRKVSFELAFLGAALGIPILMLGRWLSRRLTAPVTALTRVVREIADTDKLAARVPVHSTDELGTLARAFNRMTENLERATREREHIVNDLETLNLSLEEKVKARTRELEMALAAQQRLIGDISHEIKSPLARLGIALGLARRSASDGLPRQIDRMEKEVANIAALASELLILAQLEGTADRIPFSPVDLADTVRAIIDDAIFESPDRANDIHIDLQSEDLFLNGNSDLLHRAIENVIRNSLFYTDRGIKISVTARRPDSAVLEVVVADLGPGVPPAALPHLFEPFYRVDEARGRKTGGSGIGLTICQRVIALHGGSVRALANEPSGLVVKIELPAHGTV